MVKQQRGTVDMFQVGDVNDVDAGAVHYRRPSATFCLLNRFFAAFELTNTFLRRYIQFQPPRSDESAVMTGGTVFHR
jgi:hypothetical protein